MLALRIRDFRLYWSGLAAQVIGQHMFQFTLGWLAFEITGSQAQLAFINFCAFVPQFALTLLGGVLADRVDARKLIAGAQSVAAAGMLVVAVTTALGFAQLWHLALASFLLGVSNAIDEPTRAAFFPRLLPRSHLPSGVPLISMAFGTSRILAPSIAGFVVASFGAQASFGLSIVGVCAMIAVVFLVRPAASSGPAHGSLIDSFTDSLAYIRGHAVFKIVIMTALLHSAILMGYSQVLPVFAKSILAVDARGLGIMASAAGVGSLGGLLSYSWLQARTRPRDVMVGALTAYGFALTCVAWSDWLWFSVAMLAVVGLSHAYFMTSCQVTIQTLVPDELRGRVMGVFTMVWSLVYLSAFLLNFAGSVLGPRQALAGGSAIILAYTWLFLARSQALRELVLTPRNPQPAKH